MKPIIVFVDSKTNEVTLTLDEFQSIAQKIFDQGYEMGELSATKPTITNPYHPIWYSTPDITTATNFSTD